MSSGYVRSAEEGVLVSFRVTPGAKQTSVEGHYGESALRLKVAAPPADGKANAEVERFLARLLGAGRSQVEVVRGGTSRDKVVLVRGARPEGLSKALVGSSP